MKEALQNRYNSRFFTINDAVEYINSLGKQVSRKTVIWSINDLVKQGKAIRCGRGVYGFVPQKRFYPVLSATARQACTLLQNKLKLLAVTVTDSGVLGQFMELQPFSTVVVIETRKAAINAVVSTLRSEGVDAYDKRDYTVAKKYSSSPQVFIIRPEQTANPSLPQEGNTRIANIEKTLVDLVCDAEIYGQYQGEELMGIYRNATNGYNINYSQMLRYAAARKKNSPVLELLQETEAYCKIRSFL